MSRKVSHKTYKLPDLGGLKLFQMPYSYINFGVFTSIWSRLVV